MCIEIVLADRVSDLSRRFLEFGHLDFSPPGNAMARWTLDALSWRRMTGTSRAAQQEAAPASQQNATSLTFRLAVPTGVKTARL
jgi:hypothetical protein